MQRHHSRSLRRRRLPAYRYADRTVSSTTYASLLVVARRAVSEDSLSCNDQSLDRPRDREPFLLIVRTFEFVTAARATSTEGCSEFPANSQVF